jgi:hypothetical protein
MQLQALLQQLSSLRRRLDKPSNEEASLRQVKVRIEDKAERKALWTTPTNIVLPRVAAGSRGAEVVEVRKFPSRDILVQTKERAGKESLVQRTKWLKGVAPSTRVVPDLYPVLVHGVKISRFNTADQKEAIKLLQEQNTKLQ